MSANGIAVVRRFERLNAVESSARNRGCTRSRNAWCRDLESPNIAMSSNWCAGAAGTDRSQSFDN